MRTFWNLGCALALGIGAAWAVGCGSASAAGALAFGTTGDVAKDGYSIGIAANYETEAAARDHAMEWCSTHGSAQTKARCQVLTTFSHLCLAEAQDPKPGTPGFGWALGPNEESAKAMAMAICYATAGKERIDSCKVASTLCDTKP